MPAGSPVTVTETEPENPFAPVTETVTVALLVPAWVLINEGETEIEKSGLGGGPPEADPPPPQPMSWKVAAIPITNNHTRQASAATDLLRISRHKLPHLV